MITDLRTDSVTELAAIEGLLALRQSYLLGRLRISNKTVRYHSGSCVLAYYNKWELMVLVYMIRMVYDILPPLESQTGGLPSRGG